MAIKRGVIITGIVLAAITGASFLVWFAPTQSPTTFVISDYKTYLDGTKNIHSVLQESIELDYQSLQDGKLSPQEYDGIAQATSSQVTTQISEFITSKPPEEWQSSYINYMESMKKFNEYIRETRVLAQAIQDNKTASQIDEIVKKIDQIKAESAELIKESDNTRPS